MQMGIALVCHKIPWATPIYYMATMISATTYFIHLKARLQV